MGELVESCGCLVLAVACASQCWELAVVDITIGDHILRWQSVSQDIGFAAICITFVSHMHVKFLSKGGTDYPKVSSQ